MTRALYLIDANVILRFVLDDHQFHSQSARRLFARAVKKEIVLEIPFTAIAESVFTLFKLYKHKRQDIARELTRIINASGTHFSGPVWVMEALKEFGEINISFGDACIAAEARYSKLIIASFDRGFDKLPGIERYEPR